MQSEKSWPRTRSSARAAQRQSLSIHLNNGGAQEERVTISEEEIAFEIFASFYGFWGEYGHEQLVKALSGMEMSQASSTECFHFCGIIMQKYFTTFIIRFCRRASQKALLAESAHRE